MSDWDQGQPSDDFMETSLPACKFERVGIVHGGVVTKVTKKADTDLTGAIKKWDNGEPKAVFIFELDGVKSLWVRGNMVKAIREALGAAGAKTALGQHIEVKYYADGTPKPGFHAAKLFMCRILQPGQPPDMAAQAPPVAAPPQPQPAQW